MPERVYLVELQPGCWTAPWTGDPGRTLHIENAKRYNAAPAAKAALTRARRYRTFPQGKVVEAEVTVTITTNKEPISAD